MPTPTWTMRLANHALDMDADGHDTKGMFKSVRVATTANVTIATALNSGDTIDGVTLAAGDRVLVKDQSTGSQNGIYIAGVTPARSEDFDLSAEILGSVIYVIAGTANGGKAFKNTNTSAVTVDTTALTFAEFGAAGSSLTVADEGTPLATAATTLDFVGSGVTASGTGATKTITVSGGGGGFTHAYVGYNTIGGSNENAGQRIFLKKVTLASDCLVTSIGVYIDQVTNNEIVGVNVGLLSDVAGDPGILLAGNVGNATDGFFLAESAGSSGTARWFHRPLGYWATAADYWLAVNIRDTGTGTTHNVYFDGSGSDKTYLPASFRMSDEGWTTTTTTSNKYSIRASTIS